MSVSPGSESRQGTVTAGVAPPRVVIRLRRDDGRLRLAYALLIYAAVLVPCTLLAYWMMFTQFQWYDDEGFFEYSLRMFMAGHPLYSSVYTEYGPFYYLFFGALLKITGIGITTSSGRVIQLIVWLTASLGFGVATQKITGRLWAGLLALLGTFSLMDQLTNEPMHVAALVCWLTAAMALAIAFGLERWRRAGPMVLGALAAALTLSKVNVGGYAVIALIFAAVVAGPAWARHRPLPLLASALFTLVSFGVMARELDTWWAPRYAALVALSAAALVLAVWPQARDAEATDEDPKFFLHLLEAYAAVIVLISAITVLLGSSPWTMLRETIITPSSQESLLVIPLGTTQLALVFGCLGAGLALATRLSWTGLTASESGRAAIGVLRLVAGLLMFLPLLDLPPFHGVNYPYFLAWPLVWVVTLPLPDQRPRARLIRVSLASLAITQSLLAYPVAGSQVRLGGLLFVPCAALCLADGISELKPSLQRAGFTRLAVAPALLVVLFTAWAFLSDVINPLSSYHHRWAKRPDFSIAGAHMLRPPRKQARILEEVVSTVRAHCGALMELPGLYSFNIWSGVDTPSPMNGEQPYWATLSSTQQAQVLRAAKASPRLCVIQDPSAATLYTAGGPVPRGPLVDYLTDDFRPLATYNVYTIAVRK